MKNKLMKAGLFSLLALSALSSVSATFTKQEVNHKETALNNSPVKIVNESNDFNEDPLEYKLEQDEVWEKDFELRDNTVTNLDLNGHILSFTKNAGIKIFGGNKVLNIYDSNPNQEHHYFVDNEKYFWQIDESGDNTFNGGAIYSIDHTSSVIQARGTSGTVTGLTINIYGGTICGCSTSAISMAGAPTHIKTLNMYGGAISGNSYTADPSVSSGGAAMYITVPNGGFTMYGGEISHNYTFGSQGTIKISQANFSTTIKGGRIYDNILDSSNYSHPASGAAIYAPFSTVTVDDGEIFENKIINTIESKHACSGGGVYSNIFIMNGGIIRDNTVMDNNVDPDSSFGGGIVANDYLELNAGAITNNRAARGGGVYSTATESSQINKINVPEGKELTISYNTSTLSGAGIDFGHGSVTPHIAGNIHILDNSAGSENSNLYSENTITIDDKLTGSNIHFNVKESKSSNDYCAITGFEKSGSTTGFANEFFHYDGSDGTKYIDIDNSGNIIIKDVGGDEPVTFYPINYSYDDTEGSVLANYDSAFSGQTVKIKEVAVGAHTLKSLKAYFAGEDHDIPLDSKSFEMPNEEVTIKATFNHPLKLIEGKKPTCFEEGWKDYYYCPDCDRYYEDSAANKEIINLNTWKVGEGKLEKLKHVLRHISGLPASPISAGYKDYYQCEREECHHCYEDAAGSIEIENIEVWKATTGRIAPTFGLAPFIALVTLSALLLGAAITLVVYPTRKYRLETANMRNHPDATFTNVSYSKRISDSSTLDKHVITFNYRNTWMTYYMFTPKIEHVSENEIRARFNKLMRNGELKKYADNYYGRRIKKRLIIILSFILLLFAASAIAAYLYLLF